MGMYGRLQHILQDGVKFKKIMKINKMWIFVLLTLLLSLSVFAADGCSVNEICTYWSYSPTVIVTGANISIIDSNGNFLVNNQAMNQIDTKTYNFNYTHTVTENIIAITNFYNSTGFVGSAAESKEIYSNSATEELDMISDILQPFLIFLIGALLLFMSTIGKTSASAFYGIAGGIWFLGASTTIFFTGVSIESIFFMLIGVVAIFISIGELMNNKGE